MKFIKIKNKNYFYRLTLILHMIFNNDNWLIKNVIEVRKQWQMLLLLYIQLVDWNFSRVQLYLLHKVGMYGRMGSQLLACSAAFQHNFKWKELLQRVQNIPYHTPAANQWSGIYFDRKWCLWLRKKIDLWLCATKHKTIDFQR